MQQKPYYQRESSLLMQKDKNNSANYFHHIPINLCYVILFLFQYTNQCLFGLIYFSSIRSILKAYNWTNFKKYIIFLRIFNFFFLKQ